MRVRHRLPTVDQRLDLWPRLLQEQQLYCVWALLSSTLPESETDVGIRFEPLPPTVLTM